MQCIRRGDPIFTGLCKICWLLEMLIASSLSAFVQCFSQIDICFISRGISLTWLQCIYLKLSGMNSVWNRSLIMPLFPYPLWVAIGCQGEKCSAKILSASSLSCCKLWFLEAPSQGFERSWGSGKNTDSSGWNPGLPLAISETQKIS